MKGSCLSGKVNAITKNNKIYKGKNLIGKGRYIVKSLDHSLKKLVCYFMVISDRKQQNSVKKNSIKNKLIFF